MATKPDATVYSGPQAAQPRVMVLTSESSGWRWTPTVHRSGSFISWLV
jgi:hypothetical protein